MLRTLIRPLAVVICLSLSGCMKLPEEPPWLATLDTPTMAFQTSSSPG